MRDAFNCTPRSKMLNIMVYKPACVKLVHTQDTMATGKVYAKCTPKKFKYFRTWWLNEKHMISSSGPVLLVFLALLLLPRSFIFVSRREHEIMPSMFVSPDTFSADSLAAPLGIPLPAQPGLERNVRWRANPESTSFDSIPSMGCLAMIIYKKCPHVLLGLYQH